jgi:hypothetical protein
MSPDLLWDSREVQISFSRHSSHVAIELTLRARPSVKLVLYEVCDGLHIAQGPWRHTSKNTVIPRGFKATDKNEGFVEACCNPTLLAKMQADPGITFEQARNQGASLARRCKLSPETEELFAHHITAHTGLLAQTKRRAQVTAMKSIVKQLGDLSEEEMLDIWREARAEEVMES